jgi:hypothetical protein
MRGDARVAPDGFQYGVRFADGSVGCWFNGRTQRHRCEEDVRRIIEGQRNYLRAVGSEREPDAIVPVRRRPGEEWATY